MISNINSNYTAICALFDFSQKEILSFAECKREVRKKGIKSSTEYRKNRNYNWPAEPRIYYKKDWTNWYEFLGKALCKNLSFQELKKEVRLEKVTSSRHYRRIYRDKFWPSQPDKTYKEWKGWLEFLGIEKLSFKEIKKILKSKGVRSMPQYKKIYKKNGWPSNPDQFYKKEWKGSYDFFGVPEPKFISFKQLKKILKIEGINSWNKYNKIYKKRNWPSAPQSTYKKEWKNGYDFFGVPEPFFPSFQQLKKEVKKEEIRFWSQYEAIYKEKKWPSRPQDYYKEWKDSYDFFGTVKPKFLSFKEFKRAIKIEGIRVYSKQYRKIYKKRNWPSNPNQFYKEWQSASKMLPRSN